MAELPLDQSIPRYKQNEDRVNTFVNGSELVDYTTSGGDPVPSIRKFLKKKSDEIDNTANGILGPVLAARDESVEAANVSSQAAGIAQTLVAATEQNVSRSIEVKLDTVTVEGQTDYLLTAPLPIGRPDYANTFLGRLQMRRDEYNIASGGTHGTLRLLNAPEANLELYVTGIGVFTMVPVGGNVGGDPGTGPVTGVSSDDVINDSQAVVGTTVTEALNTVNAKAVAAQSAVAGKAPLTEAIWDSQRTDTMKNRSKRDCHIADFGLPSSTSARTSELEKWLAQAQVAGTKAVIGSDGSGPADYILERELEIIKAGQVIEFENTGGYGYGGRTFSDWERLLRIRVVGGSTGWFNTANAGKRVRTRRRFRMTSGAPQGDALSAAFNIQAEGVKLYRPTIWLDCNYDNVSPTNYGEYCDVGIFIGCRVGVQIHDPQILGYFRKAGILLDVSQDAALDRHISRAGTPYPKGTVWNGADGFHMWNPYIRGARQAFAILGARPKNGETWYSSDYFDAQKNATVTDQRGTFGASDVNVYGGKLYGWDHHSNTRLQDPVASTLSETSLNAEPDDAPACLYIDGMAGNASHNIWGMTFIGTRFASWEKFRVRLNMASRVRFLGCHTEGRNSGSIKSASGTLLTVSEGDLGTNDFTKYTYGNYAGTALTDRITIMGSVTHNDTDTFPHFYGAKPTLISDSGRIWSMEGIYNQGTSSGTSVVISSTGQLRRSTSALKYKTNLRQISAEKLDVFSKLMGYTYQSVIGGDDKEADNFGFIADYADEAGLKELVNYGPDGLPESFKYDRAVVLCHELQKLNNEEIRERLNELNARVMVLEGNK